MSDPDGHRTPGEMELDVGAAFDLRPAKKIPGERTIRQHVASANGHLRLAEMTIEHLDQRNPRDVSGL